MGFFKRNINNNNKKRKLSTSGNNSKKGKFLSQNVKNKQKNFDDEEISSDDDEINKSVDLNDNNNNNENLNDNEPAEENDEQFEDNSALTYLEAKKLVDSVEVPSAIKNAETHDEIADYIKIDEEHSFTYRPHKLSPISVCFSHSNNFIVSCSKDDDLNKRCRVGVLHSILSKSKNTSHLKYDKVNLHKGRVLCCEISPNDKFLVTGGSDNLIKIWDFEKFTFIKEFDGHRGPVNSLRFRQRCDALELFSASSDRSIIAWNMDEMGLMNRLYGHQDVIEQLDILQWPKVLSCGGMDKSCRFFKVIEESHLVFNGFAECISIDCVALINEEHFISGSADGSLYIWSMSRKKPVFVKRKAHGFHSLSQSQNSICNEIQFDSIPSNLSNDKSNNKNKTKGEPRWICSVAALPYTDLVASGSSDGFLRLWKVAQDWKSLDQIGQYKLPGFINDIRFSYNGCYIVCAVGQEHKRGRWWTLKKEAKNRIVVISLHKESIERSLMRKDKDGVIEVDDEQMEE
ncbi:hypothetical protein Mgra_00001476 [Meloidogyne graminicola]|uniref:WD_REPEATS_REGION domain-containing protein n=1 Tax=Meloidogyne graminicola TaxID=189291 RepID=A0A8T0A087_9BILA|nr:hypothetical protein Mgra_00001476 [Meloidogyne graminicola]